MQYDLNTEAPTEFGVALGIDTYKELAGMYLMHKDTLALMQAISADNNINLDELGRQYIKENELKKCLTK